MYSKKIEQLLRRKRIEPGDKVLVKRAKESYQGILMPKPAIAGDPNALVIKLASGYNIGVKFSAGAKIRKVGRGKKLEAFPAAKISPRAGLPSISMVATGGTISSRVSYETGGVKPLAKPEQLLFLAPELGKIAKMRKIEKPLMKLSEDMNPQDWQKIAKTAARLLNSSDKGLIITHGTDTLHYTTAALSFMLKNLNKPVVLTYSQRSTDRGSTDASMNLICAAHVAAKSDIAEVVLVGHATENDSFCLINRGVKVRKMHTSRRDTFRPINELPLGKVWPDGKIEIVNKNYKKRGKGKVVADTKFESRVALIKAYPGAKPKTVDQLVKDGYKGTVVEGTGFGHVPAGWLPSIAKAIKKNVIVAMAPQTIYGKLDPLVYSRGRELLDLGVVYCGDMLPEVAYVKLGWVLGHPAYAKNPKEVKKLMLTNMVGELTTRINPKAFLY